MVIIESLLEVFVKVIEGDLVSRLIFAILITMLLDCIVGKMDKFIHIFCAVLLAARAYVSLSIEPQPIVRIKRPDSDVEFSTLI